MTRAEMYQIIDRINKQEDISISEKTAYVKQVTDAFSNNEEIEIHIKDKDGEFLLQEDKVKDLIKDNNGELCEKSFFETEGLPQMGLSIQVVKNMLNS
jgi:hypothetical protein